jgi:hypothetical protein
MTNIKSGLELALLLVVVVAVYVFMQGPLGSLLKKSVSVITDFERDFNPFGVTLDLLHGSKKARDSVTADCPSGYKNMGLYCADGPHSYSVAKSTLVDCPKGWTNMGAYCGKGLHTKSLGSGHCGKGRFKGMLGRCYKHCKPGYTNTGVSCFKAASTNSTFTCRNKKYPNYFASRCYADCPKGYAPSDKIWCNKGAGDTVHDGAVNVLGAPAVNTFETVVSTLGKFPGGFLGLGGAIIMSYGVMKTVRAVRSA